MAVKEIEGVPPLEEWFPVVAEENGCVWLDGKCDAPSAEWSVLAWNPLEERRGPGQDLLAWMDEVAAWPSGREKGIPFEGGLLGQFDYPEEVDAYPPRGRLSLSGWMGLYDRALVEHLPTGRILAVTAEWTRDTERLLDAWIDELRQLPLKPHDPPAIRVSGLASDGTAEDYRNGVAKVREWIASGDIYQANLAQRFSCNVDEGKAPEFFLSLRRANPAPYSAYMDCGYRKILSTSPELFLSVAPSGEVRTRPIKGTSPRSSDAEKDRDLAASLRADPKEQAELLMIVDMERNDLGRVCRPGTVRAEREFSVETFASVHHLVGDVRGELADGVAWSDLFAATFPGGSITGAPKRRAMEIIRETERSRRGAFCGVIGWVGAGGGGRWNIAIRTMEWTGKRVEFGVGSGIVWDSDPAAEYRETLHKARRLFGALGWPVDEEELTP